MIRNVLYAHLHVDASYLQGNILITPSGNACLGDFGIMDGFSTLWHYRFRQGTVRYIAPERLDFDNIDSASKKSDVYSLAMTSFTVRSFSIGKLSDTQCNDPITIRSSQEYCHMMGPTTTALSLPTLDMGNDPSVQVIKMRTNGCGTKYGT